MKVFFAAVLWAVAAAASAADLQVTWDPVTVDDTGAPLPAAIEEYRITDCSGAVVATVAGDVTSYTEVDAVPGTGVYCRRVAAFLSPFEGAPAEGTVVVVVPGAPASISVQAIP